jgi:predicted permease
MPILMQVVSLEEAAHVVQLALTPVFLLSGIAALLNVFATRLARVADQTYALMADPNNPEERDRRLRILRTRSHALDVAVVLAAMGGVATCCAVLLLFLGEVLGRSAASVLFIVFGGAVVFTMGALAAYVVEMLLAARGLRTLAERLVGLHPIPPRSPDA